MLGLIGLPLFFLESSFGQYANSGVISIWKASPLFKGKLYRNILVQEQVKICIYVRRCNKHIDSKEFACICCLNCWYSSFHDQLT